MFVLVATLAALWFVARRYARNRVWITAQVDGGENRPLGWGPEIGIRLEQDDDGWFASLRPFEGSEIRARYRGSERFIVASKARDPRRPSGRPGARPRQNRARSTT